MVQELMRSLDPLLFAENLCSCHYPHLWLNHAGLWVLTVPYLYPTYLSPCDSFFSFRTFLLSRFGFLTNSCFVNSCYFVCLWKKVSSGSSCSAILANIRVTRVLLLVSIFNIFPVILLPTFKSGLLPCLVYFRT